MRARAIRSQFRVGLCVLALAAAARTAAAQTPSSPGPPTYKGGAMPVVQVLGVGGGEVVLEVTVDETGRVAAIRPLRTTAPFAENLTAAVQGWHFDPARERKIDETGASRLVPVAAKIVVAGFFRPPAVNGPTLGEPIRSLGASSPDAPSVLRSVMPPYPITAAMPGDVLAEVDIDARGRVSARAVRSTPPFDDVALSTLRTWEFAPARIAGEPVASRAYVYFNFPAPVITAK